MYEMCAFICKKHKELVPQKKHFLLFCKFDLPRKKLENNNFMGAALLKMQIFIKYFFSHLDHQKYLLLFI